MKAISDEVSDRSLRIIKNDFGELEQLVDGTNTRVVFSSIRLVAGKGTL